MTITFDAAAYKRTTRSQWEEAAEAWHRWGPTIEDWLGAGHRRPCSTGPESPTAPACSTWPPAPAARPCAAARRVGPGGHVLATDISPAILEYAAEHGRPRPGSATSPPGSSTASTSTSSRAAFDAVISRVGLIYFPDQQAALRGMYDALRPGRPAVVGRLLDGRPQRVLLGPGRASSGAAPSCRRRCPASPDRSASADPGVAEEALRGRGVPRRHRRRRRVAGADGDRRGVRAVREGVVRRPAPDALGAARGASARRPGPRSARRSRSSRVRTGSRAPARCSW